MNASVALLLCCVVGSAVGFYVQREAPYNTGPNDPYAVLVSPNYLQEPSQRFFFGQQGTNQVGGTGLWAHFTNKFPFLGQMFGRLEAPTEYGPPNQFSNYGPPNYQPQFYQQQYPQYPQLNQGFVGARDVGFTDDAVIVTPPHVPIAQPAPVPQPDSGYQYNKPRFGLELPQK